MRWRRVLAKGVLCALMFVAGLAHAETLKVVLTPNSVPFSYRDERGELVGFNVDIVRALCAQLPTGHPAISRHPACGGRRALRSWRGKFSAYSGARTPGGL
jgi:hypothetical protein